MDSKTEVLEDKTEPVNEGLHTPHKAILKYTLFKIINNVYRYRKQLFKVRSKYTRIVPF